MYNLSDTKTLLNFVIALVLFTHAAPCIAAEVIWTVTLNNEGHTHYIHEPKTSMTDMTGLLADAKNWLSAHSADTLVLYFPYGTYIFDQTNVNGIYINGFTTGNLVLRGEQKDGIFTKLQFQRFDCSGIRLNASNNITVEKFWLTREGCGDTVNGLYTTQGTFTGTGNDGKNYITLKLDEGFPDPVWLVKQKQSLEHERTFLAFKGSDLDPEYDFVSEKVLLDDSLPEAIVFLDAGSYKAYLRSTQSVPANWIAGQTRIALKTKCGEQTIRLQNGCDDCVLQDLKITNFADNPIRGLGDMDRLLVQRVVIDRAAPINGKTPFFSGPGGGIQAYCGKYGATIQDCTILGTADDAIGFFSTDNSTLLTNGGIIKNNYIRDNQARGILICSSENGICTGNTIVRGESSSILLKNESNAEGSDAAVRNWIVSNNTFIQSWVDPVIGLVNECTVSGLHDGNVIENNTIYEAPKNSVIVYVEHTRSLQVNNNTIVSFSPEADFHTTSEQGESTALVYVREGASVVGINTLRQIPIPSNRLVWEKVRTSDSVSVTWTFNTADVIDPKIVSKNFRLEQNYPNPFNPSTSIYYTIPQKSLVSLKLYDVAGREVAILVHEIKDAGTYCSVFSATKMDLTSGVYFYKLTSAGNSAIKKFILIK